MDLDPEASAGDRSREGRGLRLRGEGGRHPLQPGLRSEDRLRGGRGHGVLRRLDPFDGWITALDEVANVSQYPKNFFGKTTFLGASGLSVARAVLERDADVGILRVCELETLTAAGLVEPGSLRVVGEKPQQGLACVSSTELFPGLALAAQTYVPEDVRRRIAAAVYSMPVPESGYRWTLANDYRNVRRVAEKFAYAPTNKASDARFSVVEES